MAQAIVGGCLVNIYLYNLIKRMQYEEVAPPLSQHWYIAMYTTVIWCSGYIVSDSAPSIMIYIWLSYTWLILILSFIDIFFMLLPTMLIWLLGILGITYKYYIQQDGITDIILDGCLGYLVMALFYYGHIWFRKSPGLGYGDVRLCMVLSIWVGAENLPLLLFISAFSAIIYTMIYSFLTLRWLRCTPFGPFLCLSASVLLTWSNQ